MNVMDLCVTSAFLPSKSEARRLIMQGGLTLNNEKVTDDLIELSKRLIDKKYLVLVNKIDLERMLDLDKLNIDNV